MDSPGVNTNGERDGLALTEENPTPYQVAMAAFGRGSSESITSQFRHDTRRARDETRRALDETIFLLQSGADLQTLESSFGGLSVVDPGVRQQIPFHDHRWNNQSSSSLPLQNQGINGGGGDVGVGGYRYLPPHREIDSQPWRNQYLQRIPSQNNCVNGGSYADAGQSSGSSQTLNNGGFLNGNSQDVPYFSRGRHWDLNDGFGSVINNSSWSNEGFVNYHDPSLYLDNAGEESLVSLAKHRNSSVHLQKTIAEGSRERIDEIFDQVISDLCELMVDPFGCHVVQKLMAKCSYQQITRIVNLVTQNQYRFVSICIDPLGTRSIQSLLTFLRSEYQISRLVRAISMGALTLTRSNNAKFVILQCLGQFQPSKNRMLLEVIAENCFNIATDQHGYCMLQQCIGSGSEVVKRRLIDEIIVYALSLCLNCYGNYVVQYVVDLGDRYVTDLLLQQLSGNYAYLSRDKYGSHVVQKLLEIQYIDRSFIVNDLLNDIDTLLLDPFGNYVIQTALSKCKGELRIRLMRHIYLNKPLMRCNMFGNKFLEKLKL